MTLPPTTKQSLSLSQNQTQNRKTSKPTMPQPRFTSSIIFLFLFFLLHTHLPICNALSSTDLNLSDHSEIGVIGLDLMDSETNRRILAMQQKKYISYETLKRDMVPCDRAGASYYNCHARPANHYNRSCEVITACARGS
uniref:Uncharacterized protein n=1 Tax=Lotus japonicus TaxID=34305 RepID=I3S3J1_LOTJA|nr:unknown [Lotus japonicus]